VNRQPLRLAIIEATRILERAGVASPRFDAEVIAAHVLGVERGRLPMVPLVDPPVIEAIGQLVQQRAKRIPLQYLTGWAALGDITVAVGAGVFVPRPETELLIDAVWPELRPGGCAVDLCSGSGALALALADEVPGLRVLAVEWEREALPWLRRNAARTAVEVVEADVTDPVLPDLAGSVAAVVCNPPYVPLEAEIGAEVRHDPRSALFAGPDGLSFMPAVVARAAELLRPGGVLALEHDDTHARAVPELLEADGRWRDVADHADLTGRPRYATAVRA
jgi:release factor glutamine methyltransferase